MIATRVYEVDGRPELRVAIEQPIMEENGNWFCGYEIQGPKTSIKGSFGGADALQALILAIYAIRLKLELSDEYLEGRLSLDGAKDHLDLPDPALHPHHPANVEHFRRHAPEA
ncbi:hypothetical protein G3576_08200 [Roseomonas stagni]|uniref:DUF6968 domain-containing protein n=1 Tax=Falsiroseomonas algicola TaxID=2716930 RepID=A0A6M1LI76_9PROT|nr:hypothetical protein [Falsiroseomonas algicola]NGM19993.1 hypothetical protein [Falsiroseomonas algicola]